MHPVEETIDPPLYKTTIWNSRSWTENEGSDLLFGLWFQKSVYLLFILLHARFPWENFPTKWLFNGRLHFFMPLCMGYVCNRFTWSKTYSKKYHSFICSSSMEKLSGCNWNFSLSRPASGNFLENSSWIPYISSSNLQSVVLLNSDLQWFSNRVLLASIVVLFICLQMLFLGDCLHYNECLRWFTPS